MVQKQDICPRCSGTETVEALSNAAITKTRTILPRQKNLYHIICLNCGTVIRSYIEYPEDWAEKK